MLIERKELLEKTLDFCRTGSGAVVGVPGVGKTHLLSQVSKELIRSGSKVLYLPVDRFVSSTREDFLQELGITTELVPYLSEFANNSNNPSILIIDGFDAARNQSAQDMWLAMINSVRLGLPETWNVIVGVRTFDAIKSRTLQRLFPLDKRQGTLGLICRNIFVPVLSEDELNATLRGEPSLALQFAKASEAIQKLCRVPFYLKLLGDLPSDSIDQISEVRTEVELLDLYWNMRVSRNDNATEHSLLLQTLTKKLVATRTLAVDSNEIIDLSSVEQWDKLLSEEIVVHSDNRGNTIGFAHNIFFDYAVSVYEITTDRVFEEYCVQNDSSPLFLRPSLLYYGTRLWHERRDDFWSLYSNLANTDSSRLRAIVKTIYPSIIVREASDPQILAHEVFGKSELFPNGIGLILQGLRAESEIPPDSWAPFFLFCAQRPDTSFLGHLLTLSTLLLVNSENNETLLTLSIIGGTLFDWLWPQWESAPSPWLESWLGHGVIKLIAQTYNKNNSDAAIRVSKVLSKVREINFPIDFLYTLTNAIGTIWRCDPETAGRIYSVVFGYTELSEEKVRIAGPVLNMLSDRRQEYSMCKYVLADKYEELAKSDGIDAVRIGVNAVNAFVLERHVIPYLREGFSLASLPWKFLFCNRNAFYIEDGSSIWDQGDFVEDGRRIAKSLFENLSRKASDQEFRMLALSTIAETGQVALFWRSLLILGEQAPETLGKDIWELALATPIQVGYDTHIPLIKYLATCFSHLDQNSRLSIEKSLLGLTQLQNERFPLEMLERRQRELISSIPSHLLILSETQLIASKNDVILPSEEAVKFETFSSPYTEELWLSDQGIDTEEEAVKRILIESAPLSEFEARWMNDIPSKDDRANIVNTLCSVWEQREHFDDILEGNLVTKCAAVSAKLSEIEDSTVDGNYKLLRTILLHSATHRIPEPHPESDTSMFPSWSSSPRLEAARGTSRLLAKTVDADLYNRFVELLSDPDGSVRLHALWGIENVLKNPNYFPHITPLLIPLAESEKYPAAREIIASIAGKLLGTHYDLGLDILRSIMKAVFAGPRRLSEGVSRQAINLVAYLSIVKGETWADSIIEKMIEDEGLSEELKNMAFAISQYFSILRIADERNRKSSERSTQWLERILGQINIRISKILQSTPIDPERLKPVYAVVDEIVTRLYFNSGAYESGADFIMAREHPEIQKKFYVQSRPLLEKLVRPTPSGKDKIIFAQTAHHLMETLNAFLQHNVAGVLDLMSDLVRLSAAGDYPMDSLAISELKKLVDVLLADYRVVIRDGKPLQDLLDILDCFERSGNPEVLRLVWKLEEVFR